MRPATGELHLGRGTFAIIIALLLAILGGSFVGGRLSAQEFLTIIGLVAVWAFGVSFYRGIARLRRRLRGTRPDGKE